MDTIYQSLQLSINPLKIPKKAFDIFYQSVLSNTRDTAYKVNLTRNARKKFTLFVTLDIVLQ